MDSDGLYEWFMENYELTNDPKDVLKMIDIHKLFKESELFSSKNKEEKRLLNKKGFIQKVDESLAFKGFYFNDMKKIDGNVYTERIIKYKLKDIDEM